MDDDPLRKKALDRAYRLLARRARSEEELRRKLVEAGYPEGIVAMVLDKCRDLGYLNDARYARQRARDLAVNRLAGDRRIAADLRERGIAAATAREAIAAVRCETGEGEALERLVQKKTRGVPLAALDERQRARLARGLLGRGFPPGLVFTTLKRGQEREIDGDDGQ